jgi:hypothetical protein
MINFLGKSIALVHVGLSLALMGLASALYFKAVDLGWKEPLRYYRDTPATKGQNLLVASLFDKREAAVRQYARFKQLLLVSLGRSEKDYADSEMFLGNNHLRGEAEIARLENGDGKLDILDFKYGDGGSLLLDTPAGRPLGFPVLDAPVPGVDHSYTGYLALLKATDERIRDAQEKTKDLIGKEKLVTDRLIGEMDAGGVQTTDKSGNVTKPGWYYLIEAESKSQRQVLKEIDYVRPLWLKELADAQLVIGRRESLLRRLQELGDKETMSQSEFLRKQQ